jgi:hypothetical protein
VNPNVVLVIIRVGGGIADFHGSLAHNDTKPGYHCDDR